MMEKSAASSRPCTTTKRVAKKRLALKAIAKLERKFDYRAGLVAIVLQCDNGLSPRVVFFEEHRA